MILPNHTLKSYDKQLDELMERILEMGALVLKMVQDAKRSLRVRDEKLGQAAKEFDQKINDLDSTIEESATVILALQNPMANDLRFVTSAIKIAGILERAGDLAKNIIQRSPKLGEKPSSKTISQMEEMADAVTTMLQNALQAVKDQSETVAADVWKSDDTVDELYHRIFETMQKEMQAKKGDVASCTHIVFAAKNFERIADYATNLAKTVYYVSSGARPDKATLESKNNG